jgi:uncharacterized protein with PhoU and TrkA domain
VVRCERSHTNPDASFRLEEGDDLVLVGSHEQIEAAFALLDGEGESETSAPAEGGAS